MERAEFEAYLTPLLTAAYGYALRLSGDPDQAMDLVQEASVRAYQGRNSFETGTNFKAWFFKILTNVFLRSQRRRVGEEPTISLDAPDADGRARDYADYRPDPSARAIDRLDAEAVQAAIGRLPEEFRTVAMLYFLNEFRYEEIAETLDIPVGTVRSRLHRGRKLLQDELSAIAVARGLVETGVVDG